MKSRLALFIVFAVMTAVLFTVGGDAQTHRRHRSQPKPLATPPVLTGAEIISQAGDYSEPVAAPPETAAPAKPPVTNAERIRELNARIKKLEAEKKSNYDDRQKRMLMNLDILTRAEQRTESLRKQLFEMIEKENTINARLEQIAYDIR